MFLQMQPDLDMFTKLFFFKQNWKFWISFFFIPLTDLLAVFSLWKYKIKVILFFYFFDVSIFNSKSISQYVHLDLELLKLMF